MKNTLGDYGINGTNKYWPIEEAQYDGRVVSRTVRVWTLTIHELHCRYTKKTKNGQPIQDYFGADGLRRLAEAGLKPPTNRYISPVWQGCKVCGTASQPNINWKARAQEVLDAERAAELLRRERDRAQDIIDSAKSDYEKAQRDAAIAWQEAHKAEIDGVRLAAAAEWVAANPERAKLLSEPS